MKSRWSDDDAAELVARHGARFGRDLALRTYTSRLLGAEASLVLHGGGNTSLKGVRADVLGERVPALFVKASGHDLAGIEPEGHVAVRLELLRRLRALPALDDDAVANEMRLALFESDAATPSIEAPVHALVPGRYVDHTHADAVLALTNQRGGDARVREALGDDVLVLPYAVPGLALACEVARAIEAQPEADAMVWMHHGILTWGDTARASYERMIELVSRAEDHLERRARARLRPAAQTPLATARERLARVAPVVRGLLAAPTGDADRPFRRVVLRPLVTREVLDVVDAEEGRALAVSPPLTTDHLIRTKALPAWVDGPDYTNEDRLRERLEAAVAAYAEAYRGYLARHATRLPRGVEPFDPLPRVVLLPGLGALCAGHDARAAEIARDITAQTLAAKVRLAATGAAYEALPEAHLFDMEYRPLQHRKLARAAPPPLAGHVVLVTGAAGAIGAGLCEHVLQAGAHLVATDLAGPALDALAAELSPHHPGRVSTAPVDVTDAGSVSAGFDAASRAFGGVDQVVINAGLAHVASLVELPVEDFRRLERVNVEGALLLLAEAGRHFARQGTGGDVVLVSTKNVFAPGARFGAYSATKAAAHQLARIAGLELAPLGVRVNMVAPDAVFGHGARRSGLWAEVGPDRMRARGLDPEGLEAYYRDRNLLKARVTADHVARAVLFFLTRQTPTTGATLPVDGGLPDATPR